MIVTNRFNMPDEIYNLIKEDQYESSGDISVTGLISPPQIFQLKERHEHDIERDARDMFWAFFGTMGHSIMEKREGLREERVGAMTRDWVVTGTPDLVQGHKIVDYKVTSVWAVVFGLKPEWEQQLNAYAWLQRMHGAEINKLSVIAIMRDWQRNNAKQHDYPSSPVVEMVVPVWESDVAARFVRERVSFHQKAEKLYDHELPLCTAAERWERPTTYAVTKKGRKTALRVLETYDLATEWINATGKGDGIETRQGRSIRCEDYCDVQPFCHQYDKGIWFCGEN